MRMRTTLLLFLYATSHAAAVRAQSSPPPRLVVFITVDQLQQPYLIRYGPEFTGGLRRMLDAGAVFDEAYHDHAITETAPGHATVLSGRFPRSTGIVANAKGVNDRTAPLLGSPSPGASPYRFRGSVLMDWMRIADSQSHGLSVSRKDRGAILPFGRSHEPVYWYASGGNFTTSTWYADTLPTWVRAFNARQIPKSMAGRTWSLLKDASQYSEPDSVPIESAGRNFLFPHVMSSTPTTADAQIADYPFMDELIVQFALTGLRANRLGTDDHPDLLAISLSTTDAVGHRYGPDSREIHDQLLRLDLTIGVLMDSIYAVVDPARVIFALSADHGVTPFPEVAAKTPADAAAAHVSTSKFVSALRAELKPHGIDSASVEFGEGMLLVDKDVIRRSGFDPIPAIRRFTTAIRAIPGVEFGSLMSELPRTDTIRNIHARRWAHMLPDDVDAFAVFGLKPGYVWGRSTSATHGSSTDADAHVPIIFYGAPFSAGRYREFARTVDIAPTLAAALGVMPTERTDGVVLRRALRTAR